MKLNPDDADKEITQIYIKETTEQEVNPFNKPTSSPIIEMPTLNEKIKSTNEEVNDDQKDTEEVLGNSQTIKTEEKS